MSTSSLSAVAAHHSAGRTRARAFVITVSDTRSLADDRSGDRIAALLEAAGQSVAGREVVRDEARAIAERVARAAGDAAVDLVLVTGGTGVAPRDVTPEAIAPLLDRRLDGFGELFRMLSFEEIGPAAMLSRACAGLIGATPVFVLPGSTAAVEMALSRLILPELGHLLALAAPR